MMSETSKKVSKVELIIVISGTLLCMLNQFLVSPAIPAIMEQYQVTTGVVQWLTNGFTMVCALMVPMTAFLIQKLSIRNLFLAGMTSFTLGSFLIGSNWFFGFVLTGRILQAMGAGVMTPITQVFLLNSFPKEKRGSAMGMMALVVAFAPAIGPVLAGLIVDNYGWYWMFRIMAVVSVAVLASALCVLKKSPGNREISMDIYSILCSCLGFGGVLYALSTASDKGFSNPVVLSTLTVGIIALMLFVKRQITLEQPFLDLRILGISTYRTGVILIFIANACLAGGTVLIPIFVQNICGYSATTSGLIMTPGAIMLGVLSPIVGRIFDKRGPRGLSICGFMLLTLGNFGFCFLCADWTVGTIGILYTLRMMGVALINSPLMTWSMSDLTEEKTAHGVSLFNTLRQISSSVGTVMMVLVIGMAEKIGYYTQTATVKGLSMSFGLTAIIGAFALLLVLKATKPKHK